MTSGSLSSLWDFYGEAFRLHAHQLLAWAHTDVRHRLHSEMEEPDITGLLAEAMAKRRDHPDTPDPYLHYIIGDQVPHSPKGQLGNDRLRLDITVIRSGIKPSLSYVFEAKRLRTGGFPIGKYVGKGGMDDFISGNYHAECPEAAMIGLFQNKDMAYWQKELERAFEDDKRLNEPLLAALSALHPVSVLSSLPGEMESSHLRKTGTPLRLFHIFLDCSVS